MHPLILALWRYLSQGAPYDPGHLERRAQFWLEWAAWTARYCGEPYEYARLVPNQPTTREQDRARDAAIVAKRDAEVERRRQAEQRPRFRRIG